jgi:hypothetical protein
MVIALLTCRVVPRIAPSCYKYAENTDHRAEAARKFQVYRLHCDIVETSIYAILASISDCAILWILLHCCWTWSCDLCSRCCFVSSLVSERIGSDGQAWWLLLQTWWRSRMQLIEVSPPDTSPAPMLAVRISFVVVCPLRMVFLSSLNTATENMPKLWRKEAIFSNLGEIDEYSAAGFENSVRFLLG